MILEIITAVSVMCAITLTLTAVIIVFDLVFAGGECTIDINEGKKILKVDRSGSLLNALASEKIFIPSGCGGKGSCGLCKVKIIAGGGEVLPTEQSWLSDEEIKNNIRLSCQLKLRNDMKIILPEELFNVRQFSTEVEKISDLTADIKLLRLKMMDPPTIDFVAGQYMQIKVPRYKLNKVDNTFRAYSIASDPAEKDTLEFIIKLVPNGICTTYIHKHLQVGEKLVLTGPYGKFTLRDSAAKIVFVAGGSGMAPIKSMLLTMRRKGIEREARYFFGGGSTGDLYELELMRELAKDLKNFEFIPSLTDPPPDWTGFKGLVTDSLRAGLKDGEDIEAYLCGSPAMIDAVCQVLADKGVNESQIFYDKFS